MMRRRRPLARAAMVGGAAYYAGEKGLGAQQREQDQEYRIQELEAQQTAPPLAYGAPPPAYAAPPPAAPQWEAAASPLRRWRSSAVSLAEGAGRGSRTRSSTRTEAQDPWRLTGSTWAPADRPRPRC